MADDSLGPIDLAAWIADRRAALDNGAAGPVLDGDLRVLVVTGRGPRRDYHVNTVAELFYQLEGDVEVRVRDGNVVRGVMIRTGELWLAPAGVPHSPQRPVGTVGLVVEPARQPGALESFRWFCEACGTPLHELTMERVDPVALRRAFVAFYGDDTARTCGSCGEVLAPPG